MAEKIKFSQRVTGSIIVMVFVIVMMNIFLELPHNVLVGGVGSLLNIAIIVVMLGGLLLTKRFMQML